MIRRALHGVWVGVAAYSMIVFACNSGGAQVKTPELESATTVALRELSLQGAQGDVAPLRTFTRMEWDRVFFFPEGTLRKEVMDAVGADVTGGAVGRLPQPGPLLVFVKGQVVVEAVYALPPLSLSSNGSVFSADKATIRVRTKPPPPHGLTLE